MHPVTPRSKYSVFLKPVALIAVLLIQLFHSQAQAATGLCLLLLLGAWLAEGTAAGDKEVTWGSVGKALLGPATLPFYALMLIGTVVLGASGGAGKGLKSPMPPRAQLMGGTKAPVTMCSVNGGCGTSGGCGTGGCGAAAGGACGCSSKNASSPPAPAQPNPMIAPRRVMAPGTQDLEAKGAGVSHGRVSSSGLPITPQPNGKGVPVLERQVIPTSPIAPGAAVSPQAKGSVANPSPLPADPKLAPKPVVVPRPTPVPGTVPGGTAK